MRSQRGPVRHGRLCAAQATAQPDLYGDRARNPCDPAAFDLAAPQCCSRALTIRVLALVTLKSGLIRCDRLPS